MKHIAESTVRRLSDYLRFLEELEQQGTRTVSSGELAALGGTTSAQVRKDLSFFGSFGKRGLGYSVAALSKSLREILGLERQWRVAIVGAGKIGGALARYSGFHQRGFHVVHLFDAAGALVGTVIDGVTVKDERTLEATLAAEPVDIVLIAVPSDAAQAVVDRVVKTGVRAILNFAPVPVHVPSTVSLRSVNMALELEFLAYALVNHTR
ncbi:MAG: redox-sensing transcriptional repressor Rex [Gemmatimonadetes bacterium]|nr:redox-sensing transcriptional repressor Rex [Gemmatimonadota bacterium]MBI3567198.1 redox-sensing transcriptional repressor Rex [Gemmatimonadota bacterium]